MKVNRGFSVTAAVGAAVCLLSAGLPAMAAPAISRPSVTYFRASVRSLPPGGGKVQLSAAVKHATSCRFSSSPGLTGLPAKVTCANGAAKRTVRVPANRSASQKSYRFGLTVTGPGGKATARSVTVVVREEPPSVAKLSVAPADLPSAGGPTALSALVTRSAKCTVSATPAVAGLPVTTACAAGTKAARVAVPVRLPALTGSTARHYSLTLKVTGPGGSASATATGNVWPAMTFSSPVSVDAPAGWLGAVSCVSATFCMGIDLAAGSALTWDGTKWSAPDRIETGPYLDNGYSINVSCVNDTFCLAVDASGNSFVYNGTSWSTAANSGLDSVALSCATPTFCVDLSTTQAAIFNGSSWATPVTVAPADLLASVSCPSDAFCLAIGQSGLAYTYTSTDSSSGWGTGISFDVPTQPFQVSCASTSLCAAIDHAGNALLYNDGTWSSPAHLTGPQNTTMDSVSCAPGTSFCMALSDGSYYTTNGTTWSGATALDPGKASILSCATATYCMVTEGSNIFVLNSTTATQSPAPGGPLHGFTYSISCPTRTFCVAVDWHGAYLTYNGKSWSKPQTISSLAAAVDSVSCTSPTFCMAVDATNSNDLGGNIFIFNGHTWTYKGQDGLPLSSVSCTGPTFCEMLTFVPGGGGSVYTATWNGTTVLNGILDSYLGFGPAPSEGFLSCVTPTFCVAVDQLGNAFTFNGSSWSKPTALDPGLAQAMDSISCPTQTFCAAIDQAGHEYTFNGTSWTAPATIDSAGVPQTISCTVSRFCLIGDQSGNVATFNGATWSGTSDVDPGATPGTGLTGVSCPDAAHCVAVDWEGNALLGTG